MKEPFHAVHADESAVRHDFLHDTLQNFSILVSRFDGIELTRTSFLKHRLAGQDQTILRAIDFQDLRRERLSLQRCKRMHETEVALRERNEAAQCLDLDKQADLNRLDALAFDGLVLLESLFHDIPISQTIHLDFGYVNRAVFANRIDDLDADLIAHMQDFAQILRCRKRIFMRRKHGLRLVPKGNHGVFLINLDDSACDDTTFLHIEIGFLGFQQFFHVFHNTDYLLYDPVRRGSTGCDANLVPAMKPLGRNLLRRLNVIGPGALGSAHLREASGIGAVASSDDNHDVHVLCQGSGGFLPFRRRATNGLVDFQFVRFSGNDTNHFFSQGLRKCRLYDDVGFL